MELNIPQTRRVNFFKTICIVLAAAPLLAVRLPADEGQKPAGDAPVILKDGESPKKVEAAAARARRLALEAERRRREQNFAVTEQMRAAALAQKLVATQQKADQKYGAGYLAGIEGATPDLTAESPLEYDTESGKLTARTNVRLSDAAFEIEADKMEYFTKDGKVRASGDVRVSHENLRVLAKSVDVDTADDSVSAENVRFGFYPVFVESENVSGDRSALHADKATVYFEEPDFFSLNIDVENINYDADRDYVEFEDAVFKLGPLPVLYVPRYGQYGLKRPPFQIENRLGYNGDFGPYIQNTVLYSGLGHVSFGALLDYYVKRGFLVGPATDFSYANDVVKTDGWLRAGYIHDYGKEWLRGEDSFGRQIEKDRFFAEFRNITRLYDRIGFTTNVSYWKDEFVTRDFRSQYYYNNQQPDNFSEAVYYGDFFTASVFTRFAPNSWELVAQRLPEARFDLSPMKILNTGVYQNGYASYGYYREASPDGSFATMFTDRMDAYYGFTRPVKFNSWSSFTPVLGGRMTYYGRTLNGGGSFVRMLGQAGFDAEMNAWGLWQVRSKTLGIDGIRHNFKPVVKYRYIPSAEQGMGRISPIDSLTFDTYAPVFDLGLMRNTDTLYNTNTLRLGFENVFQTRDGGYGSREIARFDIYQDFNFDKYPYEGDPNRKYSFSDLYANVSVSPSKWLKIGAYNRLNVNDGTVAEVSGYMELHDTDAWRLVLGNIYLDDYINQYYAIAELRLSENYLLRGRWNYDNRISKLTDQVYSLVTRLGNSWMIEYIISFRDGATRENNFSFGARVNLLTY